MHASGLRRNEILGGESAQSSRKKKPGTQPLSQTILYYNNFERSRAADTIEAISRVNSQPQKEGSS